MNRKSLAERLREARETAGISKALLARLVGVSTAATTQWEQGRAASLRGDNLVKVARALNVREEWLQHGIGHKDRTIGNVTIWGRGGAYIGGLTLAKAHEQAHDESRDDGAQWGRRCPIISWADINQGDLRTMLDVSRGALVCPAPCGPDTFVLVISGAHAEPRYHAGEMIFVDPDAEPSDGRYVIARLPTHDEAVLRQLVIDGGRRYLRAINNRWPDAPVEVDDSVALVGVIIGRFMPE